MQDAQNTSGYHNLDHLLGTVLSSISNKAESNSAQSPHSNMHARSKPAMQLPHEGVYCLTVCVCTSVLAVKRKDTMPPVV
jgi:hypothetical protein